MRPDDRLSAGRWGRLAISVGGLLMASLWLVYTSVHGPTSFDEVNSVLGRDTLFWGMLLGVVPNVSISAGLLMARPALTTATTAVGRVGYYLIIVGLLAPAATDAALQALGPPFLMPIVGIGLILLAIGSRGNPAMTSFSRATLQSVGVLLMIAFAWALASQDVSDSLGGYRIFGAMGYLGAGIGWAVFGVAASLGRTATWSSGCPARRGRGWRPGH
jgi:hypothetical protein